MKLLLLLAATTPLVAQCTFTASPDPSQAISVPASGASGAITVTVAAGCGWTFRTDPPQTKTSWLTLTSTLAGGTGNGTGSFTWTAAPLIGPASARQAQIDIVGASGSAVGIFTVSQAAPVCSLTVSPTGNVSVPVAGVTGTIAVGTSCYWNAVSSQTWVGLSAKVGATGDGVVTYTVPANACVAPRSATVTIVQVAPNPTLQINQDGSPNNLTLTPPSVTAAPSDGIGLLNIATGTGCGWSALSDVSWMKITFGASGSGNVGMLYHLDANPGTQARAGHIYVVPSGASPIVFTVTQQAVPPPPVQLTEVRNAASYSTGAVAPGEIVYLKGTNLGPATGVGMQFSSDGRFVTKSSAGVEVLFDNTPATLTYVSATQINAVVPYGVAGNSTTALQVRYQGTASNTVNLPVETAAPGIFAADGSGLGGGAILNQDYSANTANNPAARGSVVAIYSTGGGVTNPPTVDAALTGIVEPFPRLTAASVTVTIGGLPSPKIWYSGGAPQLVAGVTQIDAEVPSGVTPGPKVPIVVQIGDWQSQTGVTVAVK